MTISQANNCSESKHCAASALHCNDLHKHVLQIKFPPILADGLQMGLHQTVIVEFT